MSKGKGKFVYKPTGSPSILTNQHSSQFLSPRKRRRSPEESATDRQTTSFEGIVGIDDNDDELDALGVAVLDNYELSQQAGEPIQLDNTRPNISHDISSLNRQGYPYAATPTTTSTSADDDSKVIAMDREINVLRFEKEKLQDSLKKFDQEKVSFQKEIQDLREKCWRLEQSQLLHTRTTSTSKGITSSNVSSTSKHTTEFTSTETFIPTQATKLKTVSVKRKRDGSTSQITSPHVNKSSQTVSNDTNRLQDVEFPETTSAQLARLLLDRDLLSVPDFDLLESQLDDLLVNEEQETTTKASKPSGLLSLLQPPPTSTSPHISTPSTSISGTTPVVTPVNRHCQHVPKDTPTSSSQGHAQHQSLRKVLSLESDSDNSFINNVGAPTTFTPPASGCASSLPSLQESLASMLKSSDIPSGSSSSSNRMPHLSFDAHCTSTELSHIVKTEQDYGVSLLPSFESVLVSYLQEQIKRRQKEEAENKFDVQHSSSSAESSGSGKSSRSANLFSGTELSSSSNSKGEPGTSETVDNSFTPFTDDDFLNFSEPDSADQLSPETLFEKKKVLEVALALEVLCKYSRQVRQAILFKPPSFDISSSLEEQPTSSSGEELSEDEKCGNNNMDTDRFSLKEKVTIHKGEEQSDINKTPKQSTLVNTIIIYLIINDNTIDG